MNVEKMRLAVYRTESTLRELEILKLKGEISSEQYNRIESELSEMVQRMKNIIVGGDE